jgi:hypothetical protein
MVVFYLGEFALSMEFDYILDLVWLLVIYIIESFDLAFYYCVIQLFSFGILLWMDYWSVSVFHLFLQFYAQFQVFIVAFIF